MKKLRKGIGADEGTDIPSFPTYEEVTPMTVEKHEEPKKPATPIVANTGDSDSNIELKVVHPSSFDEVGEIADYLIDGCTVVLNLEMLDQIQTVRMLDFLIGIIFYPPFYLNYATTNFLSATDTVLPASGVPVKPSAETSNTSCLQS